MAGLSNVILQAVDVVSCSNVLISSNLLTHRGHCLGAMSVRVVARIRPLLKAELDKDIIIEAAPSGNEGTKIIRLPNPRNEAESYSFQFNNVYDQHATQQQIFDEEGKAVNIIKPEIFLTVDSCAYCQAPVQGAGRHTLCLWGHGNRKDAYNARREESRRERSHTTTAEQHLQKESQD